MEAEGRIGPVQGADGSRALLRLGRRAEAVVSLVSEDDALRGDVFYATVAVAGVDHAASHTTTAPFALSNPIGSGVDCVVHAIAWGYISGTLGAGCLVLGEYNFSNSTNASPSGTACKKGSMRLGGDQPKAAPLYTVTLTAGATEMFAVKDIQPKLATSAVEPATTLIPLPVPVIVPPGRALVLSGVCGAAGTTPRVILGAIWKEIRRLSD